MSNGTVSVRYAKALLKFATEEGCQEQVYSEMKRLLLVMKQVAELRQRLSDPTVSDSDKCSVLETAISENHDSISLPVRNFLKLAVQAGRAEMIIFMASGFIDLYRKQNHILSANLVSAIPLDEASCKRLEEIVESVTTGTVEWTKTQDSQLMGGFTLQVDGFRLDASVRSRLERIRKELIEKNNRVI